MHVDHEVVEYVATEEQDYEEIVEEYEEEIFVLEEFQEPPMTDTSDLAPAQGKPRCITSILIIIILYIYVRVVHLRCRSFMIPTCIYIIYHESY
jgi:uncharacterized membrane protein (DUF106 family)